MDKSELGQDREEELDIEGKQDAALEKVGVRYCTKCHAVRLIARFPDNGTVCDECPNIPCNLCTDKMPRTREEIGYCEDCEKEIAAEKAGQSRKVLIIYDELIPQVQAKAIQNLRDVLNKPTVISNEVIANLSAKIGLKYYADGTLHIPEGQR